MTMNETDFQKRHEELFEEIKNEAKSLNVEHDPFVKNIFEKIKKAKSLFERDKIKESLSQYNEAMIAIRKAKASLEAEPLVRKLFFVEIAYLAILLLTGYATLKFPDFSLWCGLISIPIQCVWYGALGGVAIAIFGLYTHFQARDFDSTYWYWYICKPIMGGIFGWFIFLIYSIGLVSAQGLTDSDIKHPQLPFVISFLAGFSERFSIKLVDKLMSVLTTWEEKPDKSKPT